MSKRIFFLFLFLVTSSSPVFGQDSLSLGKIVVKQERSTSEGEELSDTYPTQVISSRQIREENLNSLADALEYVSGMDLRYRGTMGVQGDLSLRGSTYEQVAVMIDGIKINDPQTGHHNLDIPLTLYDIDRIEIIKEGDSSLYGAGAFAGSVNIITKKPPKEAVNLDALFGEHALFGQSFSYSHSGDISLRASFDHKISKAARPNTDFEYKTGSIYINKEFGQNNLDSLFGYQKKDFGADSFYSNLFPEEEEHTETFFSRTGLDSKLGFGSLKNNLFFRKHRDKFILRRNNPTSVNYHTTYTYGLNSLLDIATKFGKFLFGVDVGRDEINSTNLGKHTRFFEAGSLGFKSNLDERIDLDMRLRLDYYQKWHEQESFNIGASYKIIEDKLKLKGSISRAFRIPSFTELYYSDAANRGNPDLDVEKSDNFNLGLEFNKNKVNLAAGIFLRRGHNLIDWTRTAASDPWQATNLGKVNFRGIEFNSTLRPDFNFKEFKLEKFVFSYSYTDTDKKASGFYSKYALDVLKHQYLLDIYSKLFNINFNWQLSYNQRYYGESYFVGNLSISKAFKGNDFILEPFFRIDNFSDTEYSEVAGVVQPGRWFKSGIRLEW